MKAKHTFTINGKQYPSNTPVRELPSNVFDIISKQVKELNKKLYSKEKIK